MILAAAWCAFLVAGLDPLNEKAVETATQPTKNDSMATVRQAMVLKALEEATDEAHNALHMIEHSKHVIEVVDKYVDAETEESKEHAFEDILWDKDGETKKAAKSSGPTLKELRNLVQRHRNVTTALKHVDSAQKAYEEASQMMDAMNKTAEVGEDEEEGAENVRKLTLLLGATSKLVHAVEGVDIAQKLMQEPETTEAPCSGEKNEVKKELPAVKESEAGKSAWA